MVLDNNFSRDLESFRKYNRERPNLWDTDLDSRMEHLFYMIYIFSNISQKYYKLGNRHNTKNFINETKNELFIAYDISNLNYLSTAKKVLRSCIESFFRFCLSLEQQIIHKRNVEQGIYTTTEELKNIKELYSGKKVYKLTNGTLIIFQDTPIIDLFTNLNSLYSDFSKNVHVNDKSSFSTSQYLNEYKKIDCNNVNIHLNQFEIAIVYMIIITMYFDKKIGEATVKKSDYNSIEPFLTEELEKVLKLIEN